MAMLLWSHNGSHSKASDGDATGQQSPFVVMLPQSHNGSNNKHQTRWRMKIIAIYQKYNHIVWVMTYKFLFNSQEYEYIPYYINEYKTYMTINFNTCLDQTATRGHPAHSTDPLQTSQSVFELLARKTYCDFMLCRQDIFVRVKKDLLWQCGLDRNYLMPGCECMPALNQGSSHLILMEDSEIWASTWKNTCDNENKISSHLLVCTSKIKRTKSSMLTYRIFYIRASKHHPTCKAIKYS